MTETIQQLKEDIAILQDKLNKLEEVEKEPDMMLMRQGKVDIVDYNTQVYYRIEYTDSFSGAYVWFLRRRGEENIRQVRDINVYGVLEDYYQKQVLKQKEDYPYKKYTPEETAEGLRAAMRQAKEEGVFDNVENQPNYKPSMFNCIIDGNPPNGYCCWSEWFNELGSKGILHNLKISSIDNMKDNSKPMNEVLDKIEDKYNQAEDTPKTLYNIIDRWWCDILEIHDDWNMETSIEDLCDRIEFWILRNKK